MTEWLEYKKVQPAIGQKVIIPCRWKIIGIHAIRQLVTDAVYEIRGSEKPEFWSPDAFNVFSDVKFWMPLPELPEET